MKRFRDLDRQRRKKERVMSTPTTVKFQIAVSSADECGQPIDKLFFVDMSVTSEAGDAISIELVPSPVEAVSSSNDNETGTGIEDGPLPRPLGEVMPPPEPPKVKVAISIAA